ncbi:hypothetical protein [Dictyobacter aurantiacus]|uniref:Uncharacterized protein n=1 Tax=Dictyobacter aurantiacus TaxID=1936993 RepID=A0A401ZQP8_9CHLR|nr:hypothetical protein [Dictyobacter aurantiacus]GCE09152.1 hypothetical protein KDAU_64810 [Dictyobacter aurantiacus]
MQVYLLTVEGIADANEGRFRLTPRVLLRNLPNTIIIPMPEDPLELRLPDERLLQARVASFGIDAWRDAEGNLLIDTDPANPELSLTITGIEWSDILPGTEIWLLEPKFHAGGKPS